MKEEASRCDTERCDASPKRNSDLENGDVASHALENSATGMSTPSGTAVMTLRPRRDRPRHGTRHDSSPSGPSGRCVPPMSAAPHDNKHTCGGNGFSAPPCVVGFGCGSELGAEHRTEFQCTAPSSPAVTGRHRVPRRHQAVAWRRSVTATETRHTRSKASAALYGVPSPMPARSEADICRMTLAAATEQCKCCGGTRDEAGSEDELIS